MVPISVGMVRNAEDTVEAVGVEPTVTGSDVCAKALSVVSTEPSVRTAESSCAGSTPCGFPQADNKSANGESQRK